MSVKKKYIPLLIGVAVAAGIFLGSKLNFNDTSDKIFATNSKKDKLNRLIDYIDFEYVDQVNTDSIVDVTVNSILENLDPHSVYIPVDQYEDSANDMRGNFTGIGVSFYVHQDSIAVIRTIKGGPAEKAGIIAGDRILYADNKQLFGQGVDRDTISAYLKGESNSRKVALQVKRKGVDALVDISVKRKKVPLVSVDAAYKLNDDLGYIKLNRFAEPTYKEFKEALSDLKDAGATKLVLDLRDNPGGYISTAEDIVDEFLEDDKLILVTKNKNGEEDESFATSKGDFEEGTLYVLINENSASASEIVAGALQDNDKGIIIGRRSFGKGLVQREMALGDGSAVRLTIARYYTPTGRSIQKPYGKGNDAYYDEYESRYVNGELQSSDSIVVNDSLRFVTPKGKVVYGGGGIIPDIFVPKDTSLQNETIEYIANNGFMSYFAFEYLDARRKDFVDQTEAEFVYNYVVSDTIVAEFLEYAKINNANTFARYKDNLKLVIKANLAQQLFGDQTSEMISNQQDPMIKKVLELEGRLPVTPVKD
ncbi:MAG: carboxyl-terminal processing protease [Patiriisocius sp.]|jgi:carboxyl-terminal processing protease